MSKPDFHGIERRLYAVLETSADRLASTDRDSVREFIEVGEYGLALERLWVTVVEERMDLPVAVFVEMEALFRMMGLHSQTIADQLRERVRHGSDT